MNRRRIAAGAATLALLVGGYVAAAAAVPLPELEPELGVEAETGFDAGAEGVQELIDAQRGPAAAGWDRGSEIWSNDDEARPLASITKLVTALVCLEERPLEPGADGPVYTVNTDDLARIQQLRTRNAVLNPVPAGTEFTERQLLQLMLLPSSNEYAFSYATWVFGDLDSFTDAAAEWAERHGLESLEIVDPSGIEEGNRATAADIVRVARLALENPTIIEITSQRSAEIPGIGTIESTNPLIGAAGVVGLKTGTTTSAGYNLVAAQRAVIGRGDDERELFEISVVLGREGLQARADDSRAILTGLTRLPEEVELVAEGEEVGSVITWQGDRVTLSAASAVSAELLPTESAARSVAVRSLSAGPAGQTAGTVTTVAPTGGREIAVETAAAIVEPGLWWRATHPAIVFGWADPEPAER